MRKYLLIFLAAVYLQAGLYSCSTSADKGHLVKNVDEFNRAVESATPGTRIVLANGIWKDAELLFKGEGTENDSIVLSVETKGKVILSGNSNLRISGSFLKVEGLVFKDGFTPTNAVISFRENRDEMANNSRLTECVIDNFNNPERHVQDYWVTIFGKNNRIDHNHIEGKKNLGVTMIVGLDTKGSVENHHRIDHNYFGPRPTFGNNGGETLRIGTSHTALENSNTVVESNYFDRCNGEHEIISNKSCQNIFKYNTFFECTGTLTMRHGNETLVDGNVGAFVMMNGVPNSPPNRYVPVIDSKVNNNTFINCDHIQLCAGSDTERSQAPLNSEIAGNIFYHKNKTNLFTFYDDISGISFKDNILGSNLKTTISDGFENTEIRLEKNAQGFLIPKSDKIKTEVTISAAIATKENTGIVWYVKTDENVALNSGETINVAPGINTLYEIVKKSTPGDIIALEEGGDYLLTKAVKIKHPLTFKTSNSVISTSKKSMNENYKLFIDHCEFVDLVVNHSFDVLRVSKGTFADTISISNSKFKNISGHIAALDKETDDIGAYNVEYLIMRNNTISDLQGAALRLYRGGKDESTFGPFLEFDHNVLDHVGYGKKNKYKRAMSLYGVQVNDIENNIVSNSKAMEMHLVVGEPIVNILNNNFYKSDQLIITGDQKYNLKNVWNLDPDFIDGTYNLSEKSKLNNKGTDNLNLGLISNM